VEVNVTITTEDMYQLLPGAKAIVTGCEASEHGDNNGCLCKLKGSVVTIGKKYDSIFVGAPTWWVNNDKRARLSELTLVKQGEAS
jgi:hypothetical protein